MKSTVFLGSLGIATAAVVVGQMAAGGGGGDGENIYDIRNCGVDTLTRVNALGTYPDGTVALAMLTIGHNVGNVKIPWYASPGIDHPIIAQNLYRINADGRLEQIGMAWLKHAWFALQQSICGACTPHNNGQQLGIGCADTYSSGNNSDQNDLGPRWEIKPNQLLWMNGTSYSGSHFQQFGNHSHNGVQHRLRVRMGDLTTAGAQYWYEAVYYMLRDYSKVQYNDMTEVPERMFNNTSHRRTLVTHSGASNFSFSNSGGSVAGPIVQAWGDVRSTASPTDDGTVYVSSRAVDIGGGNFRYEYVVMNLSLDTEVESISIPIGSANVSDMGFHAPLDGYWTDATTFVNESPFDIQPWESNVSGGAIVFNAPIPEGTLEPNTIRYGTAYTFWFTGDAAPSEVDETITITPHLDGTVTELTAGITAPGAVTQPAPLTAVTTTFGSYIGGNLQSILVSDNLRYRLNSGPGFTATEPFVSEIKVDATSPLATGSLIKATVESLISQPGGTRHVQLRNFDTNALEEIDTYPIGNAEVTVISTVGGGVDQFIRDSDLAIELRLRTTLLNSFSLTGFIDRYDLVEIGVAE